MRGILIGTAAMLGMATAFVATPAMAQSTYTYSIYVDSDALDSTGCNEGPAVGAEARVDVSVSGGSVPQVLATSRWLCNNGGFIANGSPAAGAAIGLDNGIAGSDVIELADNHAALGNGGGPSLVFAVAARSSNGSDTVATATGGPGGGGIYLPLPAVAIPLLAWPALLLFAAIIALVGARGARRRRWWRLMALVFLSSGIALAANFVVDGAVSDWAGSPPLATDPPGDTSSGETAIDLRAFYAALENGQVFMRLDVGNLQNNPPTAVAGSATTLEDQPVTITLTGSDNEGDNLVFSVVDAPTSGSLSAIASTGPATATVVYTPTANANGSDSFTFRSADGQSASAAATVSITVTPVNDAPAFVKGADQTVSEDAGAQTIAGWATAISPGPANESTQLVNFNVSTTSPTLFTTAPAVASNGTLTYALAANASGSATVTVIAQDNGGTANGGIDVSAAQTFTVTIGSVNDAPSFVNGADQVALEDAAAQTVAGWATAISPGPADEATQTVSFNVSTSNATLFATAPAVASNGTLTYTLAANANGVATVTVIAQDNGGTANGGIDVSPPQTFTITVTAVNDAPAFVKGADQSVGEDAAPQSIAGWATAISAGPANESTQVVSFNVSTTNPTLFTTAPAVASNGTLTYALAANASGSATVTVIAQDNGGTANGGIDVSAAQTFTVTITAVNDAPSFVKGADQVALEDAAAQTVAGWATAISPGPADEATQTVSFNVSNTNAALFATAPAIAANGTLSYSLAANANGVATVTVIAQDNGGTANGGVDVSPPQTFTITVTAVNDAPGFVKGADQSVLEDAAAQSIAGWATAISVGPANESGQVVNFNVSASNPGLFATAPAVASNGTLSYALAANASGSATVTVIAQDNGGTANGGIDVSAAQTFTVTITAVNDAPNFVKGADQVALEDAAAQTVAGWATAISPGPADEATQTVSFNVSTSNAALFATAPAVASNGTLTYALAANANGVATVTVIAQDNGGTANGGIDVSAPQTFTITVTAVDDNPVAVNDNATAIEDDAAVSIDVLANDTDIDAGPKSVAAVTQPANGVVAILAGGTGVTYTPNPNYCNTPPGTTPDTFSYTLAPGSSTATVSVSVTCLDDDPVAVADSASVVEDSGANAINVLANDTDTDGGPKSVASITQPANGVVVITGGGTGVTYAPNANYCNTPPGTAPSTFTYTLAPGGSTATVSVSVTCVNDAPVAVPDSYSVAEDATLTVAAPGLLANDSDVDGDTLTAVLVSGPAHGSLTLNANGAFTYVPAANYNGPDSFSYRANDGLLNSAPTTVTLTVTAVNDAPVAVADSYTTIEDAPLIVAAPGVLGNDSDVDGNPLTAALVTGPASGTLTLNANGSFTYTPAVNFSGTDSFTYQANDGTANSNVANVNLTVTAVNDAPVIDLNGPAAGTGFAASYTEASPAVAIVDAAALSVIDVDSANLASATVAISNLQDGAAEILAATTTGTAITAAYTAGTLSLTGSDTVANYQTVLRSVTYRNSSTAPIGSPARLVNFVANDGALNSAVATSTVTVIAVNTLPSFTAGAAQTINEDASAQTIAGWATAINDNDGGLQTLSFTVTSVSGSLAFSSAPTVSSTGTLSYTTAANANGTATFNVVLNDSGSDNNQSAPQTLTITANAVNDAPSFVKGADQTVLEDAGAQTVNPWATAISAGPSDESAQTVSLNVTANTNAELFSVAPVISSTGVLSYTPAANAFGTATISVSAVDSGGTANGGIDTSATQTFTITINAVNDAPSFTKGADQAVLDNAGAQTVSPWATAISTGPANESGQTIAFQIVSNSAPTAFSVAPAVSPTGVLTYTPAIVPTGTTTATITLRAQDNGGTANGGINVSTDQTFTIAITHANAAPTLTNPVISYATAGNTQLEVAGATLPGVARITDASSALTKALPVDSDGPNAPVVIAASGTTAGGGNYAIQANGAFSYVPAAGYTGTDTFTYQVTDGHTPVAGTVTGTISVAVSQMVWYVRDVVDANNAAGGSGRSSDAFETLAAAQSASLANSIIFVFRGNTGTTPLIGGIALKDGQKLWGEGVGLTLPTFGTLVAAGTRPAISSSAAPNAVDVSASTAGGSRTSVEIRGLQITAATGAAINVASANAANVGVLVADNDLRANAVAGAGLQVSAGSSGTQTLAINSNSFQSTNIASSVIRTAGTLTVTGFSDNTVVSAGATAAMRFTGPGIVFDTVPGGAYQTVSGGTTRFGTFAAPVVGGLLMSSVAGDLRFDELDIYTSAGAALSVTGIGAYTGANPGAGTRVSVPLGDSRLYAVGGPIADLRQMTADMNFLYFNGTGSPTNSVRADQLSGTLRGVNTAFGTLSSASGTLVQVSNSSAAITLPAAITTSMGSGIVLTNNTGATITFNGALTLSTGTNPAFQATGGGTVTANHPDNVLTTTTGTALNVANTAIGANGLVFRSISVNGASKGIILNNTGVAGGLSITGTGTTAGSGGTIQNISQRGGEFTTTYALSLKNMNFTSANTGTGGTCDDLSTTACNAAIYLNDVNTATLDRIAVSGTTAQQAINGIAVSNFTLSNSTLANCGAPGTVEAGCLKMRNLRGTSSITASDLSFPAADAAEIVNSSGNLTLNVSNTTFRDSQSSSTGGNGLQVRSEGTANTVVNVTSSNFLRLRTNGLQATAINSAGNDVDISGSTFNPGTGTMIGIDLDADQTGTLVFNVQNNPTIHSRNGPAINVFGDTSASINGRINNNPDVRVLSNVAGSNVGSGIRSNINQNAVAKLEVRNNVVNVGSDDAAIDLSAIGKTAPNVGGAVKTLDATVTNNTTTIGGTSTYGLVLVAASNAGNTNALCANVQGNSVSRAPLSIASFRARVASAAGFFQMEGFATNAEITWNTRSNTPPSSSGSEVSFGGAGAFAGCTAALPTNPALN